MNFSDIYQRLKFEGYKASKNELAYIRSYLSTPRAHLVPESHAAILVFCRSTRPDENDVALIRGFLSASTDDYARQAAVRGLYSIWSQSSTNEADVLINLLSKCLDADWHDTSVAAFSCAADLMHKTQNRRLSHELHSRLVELYDQLILGSEFSGLMFTSACSAIQSSWAAHNGERPMLVFELDEALPIYDDMQTYLLRPEH